MTRDNNIYAKLYNIASSNLQPGSVLPFSREAYLAAKGEDMRSCDILRLRGLHDRDFFTAAYTVLLRRIPESDVIVEKYVSTKTLDVDWEQQIIKRLIYSPEFDTKNMLYKNNVYAAFDSNNAKKQQAWFQIESVTRVLVAIYRLSPPWLRELEKKAARLLGLI